MAKKSPFVNFRGLAGEQYHAEGGTGASGISIKDLGLEGMEDLVENIEALAHSMPVRAARTLAVIGVDLLANSLIRTPVDEGPLRQSGTVTLFIDSNSHIIGRGTEDANVISDFSFINKDSIGKPTHFDVDVSFFREGDGGLDVALWTHEDLNVYGGGKPAARTPGTGPKYLEIPFLLRSRRYLSFIHTNMIGGTFKSDIQHASKTSRKAGKFTVNRVKMNLAKLTGKKYYGGL